MAGGKETPRQKMIGMMYLVLTALLALNVTKEVVNAFVTINDKLDASAFIIDNKVADDFRAFDLKKMTIMAKGEDLSQFNFWKEKADGLQAETAQLISYLLGECNSMIAEAEGLDWIAEDGIDEKGNITKLKPLMDISVKDNYDIPTQLFVGSNPLNPIERGLELRRKIHAYRDVIAQSMADYNEGETHWFFQPPVDLSGLDEALKTVNPKDADKIAQLYKALTIPESLYDHGEERDMPWVSVTLNHAPIVAAAAMFTSLKVDVKNAESIVSEYMLDKINEVPYYINKIEPMAFAPSSYMNVGDSMRLNVLIAAYDSTEVNMIKWGMDADTLPERWVETKGGINLAGAQPGVHRVKGVIGVKERNDIVWKPWEFDYTVGQPMGVISQPDMRLLYRGYENVLEGTASGFPADKVTLQGSGCSVRRNGNKWVATVGSGIRQATIKVVAEKEDGTKTVVGSHDFKVVGLPDPILSFGSIQTGERPSRIAVTSQGRISANYGPEVTLTGVRFSITGGRVNVGNLSQTGRILPGGQLDETAKNILKQSQGKTVIMQVEYTDPSSTAKKGSIVFDVR